MTHLYLRKKIREQIFDLVISEIEMLNSSFLSQKRKNREIYVYNFLRCSIMEQNFL